MLTGIDQVETDPIEDVPSNIKGFYSFLGAMHAPEAL